MPIKSTPYIRPSVTMQNQYVIAKILFDATEGEINIGVLAYEKEDAGQFVRAPSKDKSITLSGADYDAIMGTVTREDEVLGDAAARILYKRLVDDGYLDGIVE